MHRYSRSESVPFDSFGAGEDGAGHDTAAAAAVNGQPAPAPRGDRYGVLRLAAALVLACVALLAIPMAAHSGPNDATLHHFELRDSSNKVLPPVRPFDPTVARHYVYYTTFDSIVNLTALPTNGDATIRFTRRPIVLQPALQGVKGTYYVPYGENRWTVVVTSANGRSTRQYSMYTRRFGPEHDPFRTGDARSRDASLASFTVGKPGDQSKTQAVPLRTNLSVEDLQPARNRTYTVTVPHDRETAWVRATPTADDATVAYRRGGSPLDRENFDLDYGENRIRITVTPDNRRWARVHRLKIIREHPPEYSNALTATLTDLGIETEAQQGLLARTFELALSEPVRMPVSELKNHALSVNGGTLGKVTRVGGTSRLVNGNWVDYTDRWRIRIVVKQGGTLTVAGNRACQLDGALCTDDGRQLEGTLSETFAGAVVLKASIEGPAEGGDEDDGRIDFEVSLSREPQKLVQVRFRTIDSGANAGTATPNVDYLPADYTLEFGPGETTKTAPVALYDDTIDDTGETVMVEISDARMILNRNGRSRAISIAAPRRVSGTIYNSDPMPQEWIARFGRTVADQVIDAVEGRLRTAPSAGVEIGLGGQRIGVASPAAGSRSGENSSGVENPGSGAALTSLSGGAAEAEEAARLVAMAEWLNGETQEEDASHPGSWSMTPRELLLGSSFSLAAETDGGGFAGLWGRMAQTRFAGREGTLGLDGDVTTALLGADYAWDRWTTGLVLSHSTGEGGYRGGSSGEIEAGVTALTPWAGYALTEHLSVWGAAGYGSGELTLTQADGTALKTDLGMTLAAAGARGTLIGGGGPRLDAVADGEVVHNDDVTWAQLGDQHPLDIGFEGQAVDRPVEHEGRDHASQREPCDEGRGLSVAVRLAHAQALPLERAAHGYGPCWSWPRSRR